VTYARWWIRQSIFNYLTDRSRLVRIPSDKVYDMIRLVRSKDSLQQQLGRAPRLSELAQLMALRPDQVKQLQEMPVAACSLNEPADTDESSFELDTLQDNGDSSEETLARSECSERVRDALEQLDPRERDVLRRYYGFDGHDPETLQGIGQDWGITRERVRQLRERALEKIRRSPMSQQLVDFVG
jgi:RNA polymerase primary sigma factor